MEKHIEPQLFTKDKPVMALAAIAGVFSFANVVLTVVRLRSNDFKVPVQYIVHDGSVLQTSNWYSLYSLALFSILSAVAIIFLAHRLHKGNRIFSAAVLAAYVVTSAITLLVTNALLSLVGRV